MLRWHPDPAFEVVYRSKYNCSHVPPNAALPDPMGNTSAEPHLVIVQGSVRVPGDKSITHRLLLLAALAPEPSRLQGALTSEDARSTARVLRQLGAQISPLRPSAATNQAVTVIGPRRLKQPVATLNCGNSGTTARLLFGILAGNRLRVTLTGDASLRRRPMQRVTDPLSAMGAKFIGSTAEFLPIEIRGGALRPLQYEQPVSSAQIKSALLLAGLTGSVEVRLREPNGLSRDHTERLLRALFPPGTSARIGGLS